MSAKSVKKKAASAKKSVPVKARKQRRRRMLTNWRMVRYGVNNFSRNVWLSVAATAVMVVTLLIIFSTMSARNVLIETVSFISGRVDMSMYLKSDISQEQAMELKRRVEKLDNVTSVRYISSEEARAQQAEQNKQDSETLEAIREASNKMPATLRINLEDINDTSSLTTFVGSDGLYQELRDSSRSPSFQGDRQQQTIGRIGGWVRLAEVGGGIATLVFVIISALVVFNTIRMAIFNRKDEIHMMKLIGAERGFIRGPFLIEATIYGLIAAIIATVLGYLLIFSIKDGLVRYEIPIEGTLDFLVAYAWLVLLAMVAIGAAIGIISSFIATRKYLKI